MRQLLYTCFTAIICCLCMQSCITACVLDDIKDDRQPDRVRKIKSAGFDSTGTLLINFTAKLDGRLKARPYHIMVNIDTAYAYYGQPLTAKGAVLRMKTHINGVTYNYDDNGITGPGHTIEFKKDIIKNGFAPSNSFANNVTGIKLYKGHKAFAPANGAYAKHIVFVMRDTARWKALDSSNYVALTIEPSSKRKYARYAFVPLTAAADVVTSPLQLIGFGLMAAVASIIKF